MALVCENIISRVVIQTKIEKLKIVSKTIKATPPDQRILSFPFLSLAVKNTSESVAE